MASTASSVSRRPAVSSTVTGRPARSIRTSITSRVVPAISEVIAASRPASAFSSVDFPAFGGPTMATSNPSRMRSATVAPAASRAKVAEHGVDQVEDFGRDVDRHLLVGEIDRRLQQRSGPDQSCAASFRRAAPTAPERTRSAWRRCASVSASIRSARPSTWARSSRPFSSARRVNSPGSASRRPDWSDKRAQDGGDDGRAAVQVELDDRLRR